MLKTFLLGALVTFVPLSNFAQTSEKGAKEVSRSNPPWVPDQGNGTYLNPVLFADYSDPDAIRVGDDYYLVSSSFANAPGLPILHSKDLVNWTLINHVFAQQIPVDHFSTVRHGQGVWAPAIRYHEGKYWIYYPDPDFGLYLTTATDPAGKWTPPVLVKAGKGLIDPCPFWDDDGKLYLIHGWAKSRAGISNQITLHALSDDGLKVLDGGDVIIDANKIPNWTTLEGPKIYKRKGIYYVFAPAGGVAMGYQAVFRSPKLHGPYEHRIVLAQGTTAINGPHQGAWVDTASGEDWFLHFQDRGPFGRVTHLEPMTWGDDGWPAIGINQDAQGKGEPVLTHRKPNVGRTYPIANPQTSDDFSAAELGLQWQWNANPRAEWASLTDSPGHLRLKSVPYPAPGNLYNAPNALLQKFPAPTFSVTTVIRFTPEAVNDSAGLIVLGYDYGWIGLRRTEAGVRLIQAINQKSNEPGAVERIMADVSLPSADAPVYLRVTVAKDATCQFAYSFDNTAFTPLPSTFQATVDRWIGARVGLFSNGAVAATHGGYADFDWFHLTPP